MVITLGVADGAAGRLAGDPRIRPEADPGVRHGQPTRVHHRDGRRRRQRPDAGRAGAAVRARDVQGRAVHGRRHHRPRHRHPRHPQAGLARATRSRPLLVIAVGATASMAALPPFLGFVAKEADYETLLHSEAWVTSRRSCSAPSCRVGLHHHVQPAVPVGCVREEGQDGTQQARRGDARAPATFLAAARHPRRGRPGVRAVAVAARQRPGRPTPTPCPAKATTSSRSGTASTCRCCCRCWCWRSAPRRSSAGRGCPRARLVYLPLGNADRIYDAVIRGADVLSVRLTGITQRGSIPATQSVILATLAMVPAGGAGARGPRPARVRAVGFAAAGDRRRADPGRRGRRDRDAQPPRGRAARRRDRLRLRRHLRVPRRARPGADPVPGGDADAGHLRAGAAHAARGVRPHQHRAGTGCRGRRWRWPSAPA